MNRFVSSGVLETLSFGRELAALLPKGAIVFLEGDVGAGKTTLVRGVASYYHLDDWVSSPTFTLMNEYRNESVSILHVDLYRIQSPSELEDIGVMESIERADISFIEWPQIGRANLDRPSVTVRLTAGETEYERIIETIGISINGRRQWKR